jgi:DNA-binding response OmpR family regulator
MSLEAGGEAGHILLVDDDEHILRSLKMYLQLENFTVRTAANGQEALDSVQQATPRLIVLDVMMPVKDGFQTLAALKENTATAKIPVIMLTAKVQDADVIKGYQHGASSYMTKPVNYDELVENIRLIIDNEGNEEMAASEVNPGAIAEGTP